MAITIYDIHWLAGLLEGEGSFGLTPRCQLWISLKMTDCDVVEHVARFLNGTVRKVMPKNSHHKPIYVTMAHGANAAGWMITLYQLLGMRRQEKIRSVITAWRLRPPAPKNRPTDKHGHIYNKVMPNGWRRCRQCENGWARASHRRKRLALATASGG